VYLNLVFPELYQPIKLILLVVTLSIVAYSYLRTKKLFLSKDILLWSLFYFFVGLAYFIYGVHNGFFITAVQVAKLTILYPLIFLGIILIVNNLNVLRLLDKTIIYSGISISLIIIMYILNAFQIWPDYLFIEIFIETVSSSVDMKRLDQGNLDIEFVSLTSFFFIHPYLLANFILNNNIKNNRLILVALLLVTFIVFISSGRTLILLGLFNIIIIPIYLFVFSDESYIRKKIKNTFLPFFSISGFLLIAYFFIIGFDFNYYLQQFLKALVPYEYAGDGEFIINRRLETLIELSKKIVEKPFFGFGSGAVHSEFIRSASDPWKYELSYLQYVFNWGFVGITTYSLGVIYILKELHKTLMHNTELTVFAISSLWGLLGILLANATNPYLLRFDSLFFIFFPIAIINYVKIYRLHPRVKS
jgi:hypothetical protein